ncbi:uncharacterized protein BYT42DRAFT_616082 [Radiomyces spectabilis]|uniref:uncharacterized protein n=1 Tax=Radiomyces spectabilis TaxID=64574 RepID=UPI0022207859|nr:uncharacterized protein BYT42DRAFT_616082 [Radiomyces spectabilis]KAI8372880.1 hypothetical protein BYT42DRAFT_616082 [Radiomyces spectabilis]
MTHETYPRSPFRDIGQQPHTPHTPDHSDKYDQLNSEDFVRTSQLGYASPYSQLEVAYKPLIIVGSRHRAITLGRGGAATVKIGKRNRQISRIHVSIEYQEENDAFQLRVLGLNGITVDNKSYAQHQYAPLVDNSLIDVLGELVTFRVPVRPLRLLEEIDKAQTAKQQPDMTEWSDFGIDKPMMVKEEPAALDSPAQEPPIEKGDPLADTLDEQALAPVDEVMPSHQTQVKQEQPNLTSQPERHLQPQQEREQEPEEYGSEPVAETIQTTIMEKEEEPAVEDHVQVNEKSMDVVNADSIPFDMSDLMPEYSEPLTPSEEVLSSQLESAMDDEPAESDVKEEDISIGGDNETSAETQVKTEEESQVKSEEIDVCDYTQVIIDALVFSRTSSMPVSDICSRILTANPSFKESRQVWNARISKVLKETPFFGEIVRKGKTADGSPKENLYYYNSERDPVEWRRATYTQIGRSARKCTLQDKQYFWKIPPKLGRHRHAYVPPPAKVQGEKRSKPSTTFDDPNKKQKTETDS